MSTGHGLEFFVHGSYKPDAAGVFYEDLPLLSFTALISCLGKHAFQIQARQAELEAAKLNTSCDTTFNNWSSSAVQVVIDLLILIHAH